MGIFSSKKKTSVSTAVVRVAEDKMMPNLTQRSMIKSIFNSRNFTDVRLEEVLNSRIQRVNRAYRYARNGDYYLGTPNHNIKNAADGRDVLISIIESELGKPITLDYYYFAPLNNLHVGWQMLTEQYGYDEFTNEVTAQSQGSEKMYVHNLVGHINTYTRASDDLEEPDPTFQAPDDGTLDHWDRHPQNRYAPYRSGPKEPIWLFGEEVEDGVTAHLVNTSGVTSTLFFTTNTYDEDMEYFQAKYRYTGDGGKEKIGYFTHKYKSNQYAILDAVHEGEAVGKGTFLPFIIFRHNSTDRTASQYHDSHAFKSSAKIADMMGFDYLTMGTEINKNEGAPDIEQAVMMYAVPAGSDDPIELNYLFEFFNWLYLQTPSHRFPKDQQFQNFVPGRAIEIADKDFSCTLSFSKLNRTLHSGNIGDVDSYHRAQKTVTRYHTVTRRVSQGQGDFTYEKAQIPYDVTIQKYRFQSTATAYTEIAVENLKLRYNIYGDKGVETEMGSDELLIPLDYVIASSFNNHDKEILYYRAMHLVFNTRITVKVKWYQRGAFKYVMYVVAAAIIFFTGGTGGPFAAALIGLGTYVFVAVLIEVIIMSLIFEQVFKVVVKELGYEVAAVLAAVMLAAGMLEWETATQFMNPVTLINTGLNLVNVAQADYYSQQITEYSNKLNDFNLMAEEKLEELKEIEKALDTNGLLDPFTFIGKAPKINFGENPDDLYNRTVHVGDPGVLAYDYIESYVDLNLRLPTFNDLVGDTFYD